MKRVDICSLLFKAGPRVFDKGTTPRYTPPLTTRGLLRYTPLIARRCGAFDLGREDKACTAMRKGGAGAHAAQQKKARLTAQREAKRKELEARLNEWFLKFDTDKSGDLNRQELKQLLVHAHPDAPEPSEQMLDMLIERSTAVESGSLKLRGDKDGTVSWLKLGPCIQKYDAFVRQQAIIEDYFSKHDTNQNASFDEEELLEVSIAPPVRRSSSSPPFLRLRSPTQHRPTSCRC